MNDYSECIVPPDCKRQKPLTQNFLTDSNTTINKQQTCFKFVELVIIKARSKNTNQPNIYNVTLQS